MVVYYVKIFWIPAFAGMRKRCIGMYNNQKTHYVLSTPLIPAKAGIHLIILSSDFAEVIEVYYV